MTQNPIESIQEYYGKVLKSKEDLQTSACCTSDGLPTYMKDILSEIHPEVLSKFYGCGSPLPPGLEGAKVLDLGCGSGRDCFALSRLVGPQGKVIGIDMTEEQLQTARQHQDYHSEKWGYSNVEFKKGFIEDLESADIASESIDLVVSNCVVNLSPQKDRVFKEVFRVLKPGGEFYFSDVFSNRRIPKAMQTDPVLLGECLGGALYTEDFRRFMLELGCKDPRTVHARALELGNEALQLKVGAIDFYSITVRAFKLQLEDRCEDYGQFAVYQGTLPHHPHTFELDGHHLFEKGKPLPVCGNTAAMLEKTRYASHFEVIGDTSTHYGVFDCGPTLGSGNSSQSTLTGSLSGLCC